MIARTIVSTAALRHANTRTSSSSAALMSHETPLAVPHSRVLYVIGWCACQRPSPNISLRWSSSTPIPPHLEHILLTYYDRDKAAFVKRVECTFVWCGAWTNMSRGAVGGRLHTRSKKTSEGPPAPLTLTLTLNREVHPAASGGPKR
jgi:hypothetical protein